MTTGILTYHRALNYGAVLQCYALQQELRKLGCDAQVIDYRQPVVEAAYRPVTWSWLVKKILQPWKLMPYIREVRALSRGKKIYENFRTRFFNLTEACDSNSVPADMDAYIVGSDQMWANHITGSPDPVYYGEFARKTGSRLIGYAVSGTPATLNELGERLPGCIDRFDSFTFRERALAEIARERGKDVGLAVDPTLLTTADTWSELLKTSGAPKNAVVLYEVRRPKNQKKQLRQYAESLAASLGTTVVELSGNDMEVADFVGAIANAACVITSSFHATVFSLIFRRPFYTYMLHDGKDSRYTDLLAGLGLNEALVELDFKPDKIPAYDYSKVESRLNEMRAKSHKFLKDALDRNTDIQR